MFEHRAVIMAGRLHADLYPNLGRRQSPRPGNRRTQARTGHRENRRRLADIDGNDDRGRRDWSYMRRHNDTSGACQEVHVRQRADNERNLVTDPFLSPPAVEKDCLDLYQRVVPNSARMAGLCSPSRGTGRIGASCPAIVTGGSNAFTVPPAVATARQRFLAAS